MGGENHQSQGVIIASDSLSAFLSIQSGRASCRQDLIYQILHLLLTLHNKGVVVSFLWVPAHVGVEGNEVVDMLAKNSIKHETVDVQVPISRAEVKTIIKQHSLNIWQEYWNTADTGRHLYSIQNQVITSMRKGRSPREEMLVSRLRMGHTGLSTTLHRIGKHPTGLCTECNVQETVKHILLDCKKYEEDRAELKAQMDEQSMTLEHLLGKSSGSIHNLLILFLKNTGLSERI